MVRGFRNVLFGGECLFLATLTGTGRIWLQSMPILNLVTCPAETPAQIPRLAGSERRRRWGRRTVSSARCLAALTSERGAQPLLWAASPHLKSDGGGRGKGATSLA